MFDGVVQQVARQFAQHPVVRIHRRCVGFEAEVEVVFCHQRRQVQRHGTHNFCQVDGARTGLLAQLLHFGQ